MSNKFKLPEVIANNLRDLSNPDENIFCVYKYVKEHINNDDDLEQLYLAIIEFKPNAQIVSEYAMELFEKNRIPVAVSLMKNKEKYSGDDHSWKCFQSSEQDILQKLIENTLTKTTESILDKVSVLSNPSCNEYVLTLSSEDTGNYSSSRIRKTVALNSGTPKVVIDKLIIDEHRWVREAAASHPTIDKQKIDELIKTGDRYLLKGLASNPNCTKTTKVNINSLLKDEEKYPLHWIETVESHKMDGVPVHPKRFWLELGSKATTAEWLYDKIYDGDGGYTDIDIDEWNEDEDLGEVGYAYYLWVDCPKYTNTNAAFFQVNVYLPNQEATDIYIVPLDDVISDLIEKNYREEIEDLFERYPWIADVINEEDVYKK
jgi:hypothetical protein